MTAAVAPRVTSSAAAAVAVQVIVYQPKLPSIGSIVSRDTGVR